MNFTSLALFLIIGIAARGIVAPEVEILPKKESFGEYLIDAANATKPANGNATKPEGNATVAVGEGGPAVAGNATGGAEGGNATGGAEGGNATGTVGLPLLPRFQSFGDYLVEISLNGSAPGSSGDEKAEGESSGGGGVEDPAEPGAPSWAPACKGKPDPKAVPPNPEHVKDAKVNCIDNHTLCPFWETRGWCKKGPEYMKNHCSGACDTSCAKKYVSFAGDMRCIDKRPDCHDRQAAGQCVTSPFFMIWQCPLACKFCLQAFEGDAFVFEYSQAGFTCKSA